MGLIYGKEIQEEDYRQLSELQHFAFCKRQWALIHIEQQWEDNLRTIEGELMHERVHDETKNESRGDLLIIRGLRVKSDNLCVTGICDAVEFRRDDNGITLHGRKGKWLPRPVEYKRGKPKTNNADELQVCAQAICLEEMLCCSITSGDLFYGEKHRRQEVIFSEQLREEVKHDLQEMNELFFRGCTPKAKRTKACDACSLINVCLPELENNGSVLSYLKKYTTGFE
jgi:CRISPR-associated exonuclease Cas4